MTHNAIASPTRGRYPFAACCACGWVSRGYAADHAAQIMADDHNAMTCFVCGEIYPSGADHDCPGPMGGLEA